MLALSLLLNVGVLAPVCAGLLADSAWARRGFGARSPARGILLGIYLAIGLVSLLLLFSQDESMATGLLLVQVVYKFISPLTVDTLRNPVAVSNLVIATFHTATLWVAWA